MSVEIFVCRHCGTAGPSGEDHSCSCPLSDEECIEHREVLATEPPRMLPPQQQIDDV